KEDQGENAGESNHGSNLVDHHRGQQQREVNDGGEEKFSGVGTRSRRGRIDEESEEAEAQQHGGAEIEDASHVQGRGEQRGGDQGNGIQHDLAGGDVQIVLDDREHFESAAGVVVFVEDRDGQEM